jgi:hypothetical protein
LKGEFTKIDAPRICPLARADWGRAESYKALRGTKLARHVVVGQEKFSASLEGALRSTRITKGVAWTKPVMDHPKSVENWGGAVVTCGSGVRPFMKTEMAEPSCAGFVEEFREPSALSATAMGVVGVVWLVCAAFKERLGLE